MSGKGSRRRPGKGYEENWDRIFKKENKMTEPEPDWSEYYKEAEVMIDALKRYLNRKKPEEVRDE